MDFSKLHENAQELRRQNSNTMAEFGSDAGHSIPKIRSEIISRWEQRAGRSMNYQEAASLDNLINQLRAIQEATVQIHYAADRMATVAEGLDREFNRRTGETLFGSTS